MYRRQVIKLFGAGLAAGLVQMPVPGIKSARADGLTHAIYLLPGYLPDYATKGGVKLTNHPEFIRGINASYDGPRTMVTRLDESSQQLTRAIFPVKGHHIAVSPDRRQAFFSTMDDEPMVLFDPHTLEFLGQTRPHSSEYVGGGHAVYLPDGLTLVVTERRRLVPWSGSFARHEGRITIRDAKTLQVLESYPCGGIHPHDIALMADGRHVAIANYGRTSWPGSDRIIPNVVEPSLSVVDLVNGSVSAKLPGRDPRFEIRHLAGSEPGRLFAIQTGMIEESAAVKVVGASNDVLEVDRSAPEGLFYTPAPVLGIDVSGDIAATEIIPDNKLLFRQGQSIVYDSHHDEAIVTFTSSNIIAVINGDSRRITRLIHTDRMGLWYPRGVALHPDGIHYAVSGSWRGLYLFRRGSHALNRERCWYETFFDHSHMSIA